jgi:hypothetical protein
MMFALTTRVCRRHFASRSSRPLSTFLSSTSPNASGSKLLPSAPCWRSQNVEAIWRNTQPRRRIHTSPGTPPPSPSSPALRVFNPHPISCVTRTCRTTRTRHRVRIARLQLDDYPDSRFTKIRIQIHFKDAKGNLIKTVEGNEGDDLLSIAHEYDIDLEGPFCLHLLLSFDRMLTFLLL